MSTLIWVALYVGGASPKDVNNNNNAIYFDSFGVEHIAKEIKAFIDCSLSIAANIFRIQAYDSIMCGYFCIGLLIVCLQEKP